VLMVDVRGGGCIKPNPYPTLLWLCDCTGTFPQRASAAQWYVFSRGAVASYAVFKSASRRSLSIMA
jgi:hypothetical protein